MARLLLVILMLAIVAVVVEAEFCRNFNNTDTPVPDTLLICKYGCCGVKKNMCCNTSYANNTVDDDNDNTVDDDNDNELTAGAIAGVVIASLAGLNVVIGGVLLVVSLVDPNCCKEEGNQLQGVVFATGACANPPTVNIGGPQPTLTKTQTTNKYPQKSTQVYNAGYI